MVISYMFLYLSRKGGRHLVTECCMTTRRDDAVKMPSAAVKQENKSMTEQKPANRFKDKPGVVGHPQSKAHNCTTAVWQATACSLCCSLEFGHTILLLGWTMHQVCTVLFPTVIIIKHKQLVLVILGYSSEMPKKCAEFNLWSLVLTGIKPVFENLVHKKQRKGLYVGGTNLIQNRYSCMSKE